jgi:hypothetical protein
MSPDLPISPLEREKRDSLCEAVRDAVWALGEHRGMIGFPLTDAQMLVIGIACQDLKKIIAGWNK